MCWPRIIAAILACLPLSLSAGPLRAEKASFAGPVQGEVLRVIDGDTVTVRALVWPGQSIVVNVRIRGVDAPEMHSRCEDEHRAALRARDRLAALVGSGAVYLSNIAGAKYYGRVLADLETESGEAVAARLLGEEMVRPYRGGRRLAWCG